MSLSPYKASNLSSAMPHAQSLGHAPCLHPADTDQVEDSNRLARTRARACEEWLVGMRPAQGTLVPLLETQLISITMLWWLVPYGTLPCQCAIIHMAVSLRAKFKELF